MARSGKRIWYDQRIAIFYYSIIVPLSHLPLGILYRISDVLFFVLFYLIRYRKNVVLENLHGAFPEKSATEIKRISRKFYQHLCDLIIESIKGSSISPNEIARRHRYTNPELLGKYYEQGKSLTILGAHFGNWEWVALSLPQITTFQTYGIFQTINNPFLDKTVKASRERNGMRLINKREVESTLQATHDKRITMGYIADQSPARTGRKHWMKFLNQETAVTTGFEGFAKRFDTPVLYLSISKVRRGYYEGTFHLITEAPRATADGELVEKFMRTLEVFVQQTPEYWLWSHRRWKLKRANDTVKPAT